MYKIVSAGAIRRFIVMPGVVLGATLLALAACNAAAAQNAAPAAAAATPPTPAQCGIPGHHALLERMTEAFNLTCDQEKKIEPLLHDEESVSKPLIAFQAFTADEKKDVMQQVKLAARKQILPLLTAEQQVKMDQEIDTVSKGGEGLQKGNGRKGGGKAGGGRKGNKGGSAAPVDPYDAEESLCNAISKYAALSDDEKKTLILKVKQASLRPDAPQMTPDQARQVADEVKHFAS